MEKIKIGSLEFDCRISGNKENALVILLHGFPESSIIWRALMQDLSAKGYYCIAPNLRGYSSGARPRGRNNYSVDKLAKDVMDIARAAGKEKFHLIGHDWGSAIGWQAAHDYPNEIISWTGLSIPHLQGFFEAIMTDEDQKERSKYIKRFQFPFLPELKSRAKDFKLFREIWKEQSKEEIADYLSIFRQKGTLAAAFNYYRANYDLIKNAPNQRILGDIQVPTLFIWGANDVAIGPTAVEKGHAYVKADYQFLKLEGGHWLMQSNYDDVKPAIMAHLAKHKMVPDPG